MKKCKTLFLLACLALCLIPLVGMIIRPTTESTENRVLSPFPAIKTETGSLNLDFFKKFETWFQEHFAFRNELVSADAYIQGSVFGTSSTKSVVYGQEGWLYYTSTLKDFLGTDRMTSRELYNLAHNLGIVCRYVEGRSCKVLLAVPPNKSTLYGQYMPYYDSLIADSSHDMDRMKSGLEKARVPYVDLAELFRKEDEILYLKRDSHWNNKGAMMVYNIIMDSLGYSHENYGDCMVSIVHDEDGDLNRMLYSFYGKREDNYAYDIPQEYYYVTDTKSVEDSWIETENPAAQGKLLMFRDSFGNTLLPLFANQFERACFSKEGLYWVEKHMDECSPDVVVMEKVERNLADFITKPPLLTSPEEKLPQSTEIRETDTTINLHKCDFNIDYCVISGEVDNAIIQEKSDIIVQVNQVCYNAYHIGENGFLVYMKKENMPVFPLNIRVFVKNGQDVSEVQRGIWNEAVW